ncbi:hypothetical protein JL722_11836 [Aureococcus anophagefferens]|nr:hypothetical protein JL722_11836 [Aureococcus anophagefferens]
MEETPLEAFGDAPPAPPCDGTVVVDADAADDDAGARVAALSSAKAQHSPTMASSSGSRATRGTWPATSARSPRTWPTTRAGLEAAATEAVDDLLYGAHLLGRRARWASAFFTLAALGGLSLLGTHGVWYLAWYVPPSLPPLWWKLGMGLRWLAAPVGLGPAAYEELARARLAPRDPLAALGRVLAARRAAYAAADDGAPADGAAAPSFSLLAVFGVKRFARRAKASKRRLDEKKPALSLPSFFRVKRFAREPGQETKIFNPTSMRELVARARARNLAERRGSRGKVPMPLTFTEGENGYLAGWWTTRVVAYLPTFPPPQLEGSALYPLWCLYRGRMLAQNHVEYALPLGEARRLLRVAREAYPRAPVLDLYAGRCRPWPLAGANASLPDSYAAPCPRLGRAAGDGARDVAWAPDWAADTRFALEHLEDVMLYWFEDRQDPDGSFGGGWGDDVEAWRKFKALLLGFDFYRYKAGWERVSRSVHGKSSMRRGYSDHMSDVEHSAEPSADTVWPMQLINWGASYDDDSANAWRTIAARIGALQDAHWLVERETKSGAKTHVVRSSWIASGHGYALDFYPFSCSLAYHVRAIQPALGLLLELSRSPVRDEQREVRALLNRTVTDWLRGWVDASLRGENGKPPGVIPSAQYCPDAPLWLERETGVDLIGLLFFGAALGVLVTAKWRGLFRACLRRAEAIYQRREGLRRESLRGARVAPEAPEAPKLTLRTVLVTKRAAARARRRSKTLVRAKMGLAELLATTVVDESPAWLRPYLRRLFTADALAALLATVGAVLAICHAALGLREGKLTEAGATETTGREPHARSTGRGDDPRGPLLHAPFLSMTATLNAVYNGTYAGPEDEGSAKWAALELESAVQSTLKVADALGLLGFVPPDVKHYYETHGRPSGYEAYRLGFDDAWDGTGEFRDYFSYDEAAFTSEVRFTDRIFSFHGAWRAALGDDERYRSGKRDYKPDKLYMAVTGDVVAPNTLPVRAVVWRTRAADLGVIVCPLPRVARTPRGQTSFVAKLFHFGESPRPMGAVLHELADGSYSWFVISNGTFVDVAISAAGGLDNATKLEAAAQDMAFGPGVLVEASGSLDVARPRAATPLDFVLPPRVAVELGVFRVGR